MMKVYVADGYGNYRVIVFDYETGKYKRHWGAYGKPPTDENLGRYVAGTKDARNSEIRYIARFLPTTICSTFVIA